MGERGRQPHALHAGQFENRLACLREPGWRFRVGLSKTTPRQGQVSRESMPRKIFNIVFSAISKGEFLPGDRLREAVLAEKLNVSQASIREALQFLLVMRDPNRGITLPSSLARK